MAGRSAMAYVSVDSYFELRAYTWAFVYLIAIVTDMVGVLGCAPRVCFQAWYRLTAQRMQCALCGRW